jgi:hypothetical protein
MFCPHFVIMLYSVVFFLGGGGQEIRYLFFCVMKINVPTLTDWHGMEVRTLKYSPDSGNSLNVVQFLALW